MEGCNLPWPKSNGYSPSRIWNTCIVPLWFRPYMASCDFPKPWNLLAFHRVILCPTRFSKCPPWKFHKPDQNIGKPHIQTSLIFWKSLKHLHYLSFVPFSIDLYYHLCSLMDVLPIHKNLLRLSWWNPVAISVPQLGAPTEDQKCVSRKNILPRLLL